MRIGLVGGRAGLALSLAAVAGAAGVVATARPAPGAPTRPQLVAAVRAATVAAAALPQGQLALGVAAGPPALAPGGWAAASGVPWTYTYQYLAGGVNTGGGWQTWNAQGQFPIYYARAAQALKATPVFPYYTLLQSNGPCRGCGEAQKDLAHLDDPATMASWYQDFATLMKRLGPGSHDGVAGYAGPAIVHVEPDLSGYAEAAVIDPAGHCYGHCHGGGNDPTHLHVAVAATGVAEVMTFPDSYQGFNDAILHLRDLYAPNVALAFHVSNWSTLNDVGGYTGTDVDFAAQGVTAGSFAAASGVVTSAPGVSTYDLVFNDVADNDAGKNGRWWDRTNRTVPNFNRWESYVASVHRITGKGVMVWQVPVGNQWFDTENNTWGHYQDNRVEYFLARPTELVAAGVVGVLFGAGNAGSTVPSDGMHDGVTNPASFCNGAGMGGGSICNNHTSSLADDDGGYLRLTAAAYYQHPAPLGGGGPGGGGPAASGGYWLVASDGGVFSFGQAAFYGSTGALTLNRPIVGMTATPDGHGYWIVASDGGIFNYGDAAFYGSTGALTLNRPIVGMTATPDGHGYWIVASDGGIFNYGDAAFYGSTGALTLKRPIVGMTATPDGHGYWLVASDGGIFNYGDAAFYGSTGALALASPVVGMARTPPGAGYWMVAADGGIFGFGAAAYAGSGGGSLLAGAIVGMAATTDGGGYWLSGNDGTVLAFGNASALGSAGAGRAPVVGIARTPG